MTRETNLLKTLRIASPCHENWETMTGDERVRKCDACNLHVYNFAEMTENEVISLVTKTEGRLCGRLHRRADGTMITRDCPVGLRALQRKISRVATVAFATILSACSFVFAQTPKKDKECKEIPALTIERKKPEHNQSPGFTGTVLDPQGASVSGATVILLDASGNKLRETTSTENGEFSLAGVPDGSYSLEVSVPGFKKLTLKNVELRSTEIATARFVLNVDESTMVIVGLVATPSVLEKSGGTTIIGRELIRKLPIYK